MKIYHVTQDEVTGYDTYSDMVVIASDEKEAQYMHPSSHYSPFSEEHQSYGFIYLNEDISYDNIINDTWPSTPEKVKVLYLGESAINEKKVICASFHAG